VFGMLCVPMLQRFDHLRGMLMGWRQWMAYG
jgi:hypothetical protein